MKKFTLVSIIVVALFTIAFWTASYWFGAISMRCDNISEDEDKILMDCKTFSRYDLWKASKPIILSDWQVKEVYNEGNGIEFVKEVQTE